MKKTKHTPAPWQVGIMESPRSNEHHAHRDFAYYLLGNPEKSTLPNADANANLIAHAPILFETLEQVQKFINSADFHDEQKRLRVCEAVDQSLCKARGGGQ